MVRGRTRFLLLLLLPVLDVDYLFHAGLDNRVQLHQVIGGSYTTESAAPVVDPPVAFQP